MATASVGAATESRRSLALVIGIGQYQYGKKLKSVENDAYDMSTKLRNIGFITGGPKINLTYQEMKDAFKKFQSSIYPGDMILFYFAGHGTQWKVSTLNLDLKNGSHYSVFF
jgi:uncharacterized caspase-like protein